MKSTETLEDAIDHLLDKMAAQESLMFLLARYVVDTGVVTEGELAEHIRAYSMPEDTLGTKRLRDFYADVIDGGSTRRFMVIDGSKTDGDCTDQ
jgi:hypothetical protein